MAEKGLSPEEWIEQMNKLSGSIDLKEIDFEDERTRYILRKTQILEDWNIKKMIMKDNKTIRLIYPQWQGADISRWIPNIPPAESSRGYYLGAKLLDFLSPITSYQTFTVPVSKDLTERTVEDGVIDRNIIVLQTKAALEILEISAPVKVITLGGECSVSVPVFTFLNEKYDGDVAVIWLDAHPDITLPQDDYNGYHAMALSAIMGKGDSKIVGELPSKIDAKNICLAGLRECEYQYIEERVEKWGLTHFSPSDIKDNSEKVIQWLESTGKSKVMIHFDMDVLDPSDILAAVADGPEGGLKLNEAVRFINDISKVKEMVAITVAEPMPRIAIRLKQMLSSLPLINEK